MEKVNKNNYQKKIYIDGNGNTQTAEERLNYVQNNRSFLEDSDETNRFFDLILQNADGSIEMTHNYQNADFANNENPLLFFDRPLLTEDLNVPFTFNEKNEDKRAKPKH